MAAAQRQAPVLLVANKADNDRRERRAWEFLSLGLGEPFPVTALHGRGTGDLLDELVAALPDRRGSTPTTSERRGRPARRPRPSPSSVGPNVGK